MCRTELVVVRCQECGEEVLICRRCWRNHRYCGEKCSEKGRERSQYKSRKNYRASSKGRSTRAKGERRRRMRRTERERANGGAGVAEKEECSKPETVRPEVGSAAKEKALGLGKRSVMKIIEKTVGHHTSRWIGKGAEWAEDQTPRAVKPSRRVRKARCVMDSCHFCGVRGTVVKEFPRRL